MNTVNPFYEVLSKLGKTQMRLPSPVLGIIALILLIAIPVGGTPSLQIGSNATYNLDATISFPPPVCETTPTSGMAPSIIACPLIVAIPPTINITGTLGWTDTDLNSTTAALNITRDITISSDGLMMPNFHNTGSFNESIDLATRLISITPFIMTEMDNVLQMSQSINAASFPSGLDPSLAIGTIESTMTNRLQAHTMWWVNGPLKLNQTVPVLVFPTNVSSSTTVNLPGGTGPRNAWALVFKVPTPIVEPQVSTAFPIWTGNGFSAVFTFNYDQMSDVLLSATFDIHMGFQESTTVAPTPCETSTTFAITYCNDSGSAVTFTQECGFGIHASLILSRTNLNLNQPRGSTDSSSGTNNSGSTSGSNPGGSTGGTGGTGSGPSDRSNGVSSQNSGSSSGGSSSSGSGSGSNSVAPKPTAGIPWIYWLLGIVIAAVLVAGLFFARNRRRKLRSPVSATGS